jgi:hypothetical protein
MTFASFGLITLTTRWHVIHGASTRRVPSAHVTTCWTLPRWLISLAHAWLPCAEPSTRGRRRALIYCSRHAFVLCCPRAPLSTCWPCFVCILLRRALLEKSGVSLSHVHTSVRPPPACRTTNYNACHSCPPTDSRSSMSHCYPAIASPDHRPSFKPGTNLIYRK